MGRTELKRRALTTLLGVGAAACVAGCVYDRYEFCVVWPEHIQRELNGTTLARSNNLISSERHFAWGQGFARWKYRITAPNRSLQLICRNVEIANCSFSKRRTLEKSVDLDANLSAGVLTVEEWWS
jgi:hypothetical protein